MYEQDLDRLYKENRDREALERYERVEERNWTEVAAGALFTAAGLYLISRGLQERANRHTLPLPKGNRRSDGIQVRESVTVNKPAAELYSYWRRLENLPTIMRHLKEVEDLGAGRSHWVAKGPLNTSIEWDAVLTMENENSSLAWKSLEGATVPNEGSVLFKEAPGGRGTEIHVSLTYHPPLGALGATFARLFGEEPSQQVGEDLKRFKQRVETGEIATTQGQPTGQATS